MKITATTADMLASISSSTLMPKPVGSPTFSSSSARKPGWQNMMRQARAQTRVTPGGSTGRLAVRTGGGPILDMGAPLCGFLAVRGRNAITAPFGEHRHRRRLAT